jgi:hypothetical protein
MQNVKYKTSEGRIENFIGSSPTLTKYLFNRKIKQRQEAQKAKQIATNNSENLKQQCQ